MDAVSFGKMQAEVKQLREDVAELKQDVKMLLEIINKSKGGVWGIASATAFLSSAVTWVAANWSFK